MFRRPTAVVTRRDTIPGTVGTAAPDAAAGVPCEAAAARLPDAPAPGPMPSARDTRRAAALRANLRRRKAQARARDDAAEPPDAEAEPPP